MNEKNTPSTIEAVATLISSCLQGDPRSRETMARWCLPRIRRLVLLTYGRGPDAEDLIQTAVSRIFSRLDSYRGDASFYNWVERITINILRDYFRTCSARSAREVPGEPEEDRPSQREAPDEQVEHQWVMGRITEHLRTIKLSRRLPLALALLHDYTAVEIAVTLNISPQAARKRIQRGRKELTAILKRDPRFEAVLKELLR